MIIRLAKWLFHDRVMAENEIKKKEKNFEIWIYLIFRNIFHMKLGYYMLLHRIIQKGRENGGMAIDAIIFAALTMLCMVGVCWIIGKIHPFEHEVAWNHRKE